jgi:hypothetical protein
VHNGFEDPQFSNFYGQTLPLLKRGIPVKTVHMENLSYAATLKDVKVLIMSYSNMKPMSADVHKHLAEWVNKGGVLVYCGRDDDPYQKVMEWWNTKDNSFAVPSEHLFKQMKIQPVEKTVKYNVGKGKLYIIRQNPKEFVLEAKADDGFVTAVKEAYQDDAKAGQLQMKNNFYLKRGPYDIVSVMDEGVSMEPYVINGPIIDLFDPKLPALARKTVEPGTQGFLFNIGRVENKKTPQVLASASRIYNEERNGRKYSFTSKSPAKTRNSMRVLLPAAPKETVVANDRGEKLTDVESSWDAASGTLYLGFDNSPEGVTVTVSW